MSRERVDDGDFFLHPFLILIMCLSDKYLITFYKINNNNDDGFLREDTGHICQSQSNYSETDF